MAIVVEGDLKASFSIATTLRCMGGRYSFPLIAPLYPWSVPYNTECLAKRHQVPFLSLWYNSTWDWTQVTRAIGERIIYWYDWNKNKNNSGNSCERILFSVPLRLLTFPRKGVQRNSLPYVSKCYPWERYEPPYSPSSYG